MSLYEGAVKKPIMTSLCFLAVVIFGLFSLSKLPIDLYPDIDTNTIMVMTAYPGASASDIENNVTRPLENTLNAVSNLKHITSRSSENMSLITLEFEFGNDIDVLTNDVRDKLDMVSSQLPDDVENPIIFKFSTDMIPIVLLSVQANESQSALYKILDDRVVNPLARIPGVGTVSISGAPQREIQVYCDPNKLEAYHLTIETISSIIGAENKNIPGGNFDIGSETYALRVEGEFDDSRQLADVVVGTHNGANVFLRDVARIVDTVEERAQETYNNGVQGAMIVVQKQSGANSVEISKKVADALPRLQKNLPSDVKIGVIVDTSDNILNTIDSLTETVVYALLFVVIVVFLFLGRWRATLIICITIPLSLIASFIYLAISGNTINIISLSSLSIAIGMVVDDAIVVLENVTTHIERGSDPKQAAVHGTNEVAISVIASTLTMIAVFFPLTLVSGMTGILFKQLGWIVCITVCTSTLTAISLTPMLCSQLMRIQEKTSNSKFSFYNFVSRQLDRLDSGYERLIRWVLHHKTFVICFMTAIFLGSCSLTRFIKTDFMPQNDQSNMTVYAKMQSGQRVEETKRVALQIDSMIRADIPEITIINLSYGSEEEASFASMMNSTGNNILNMRLRTVDIKDRERSIFVIADQVRSILKSFPDVLQYTVSTSSSGGSMGSNSVDIEIMGHDFNTTTRLAQDIAVKARQIPGAEDIKISRDDDKAELQIALDQDKLARHGLTTSEVGSYVRNRIYGFRNSKFKEDGEEYDIIVRLDEKYRSSLTEIENILIIDGHGEKIRLKELGEIKEYFSPPNIERKSKQRILKVSITPAAGVALGDIAQASQQIIDNLEDVPQDVSLYIGGNYEDQQESFSSLIWLLLLSLMLVYIVMAAQFESFKMPFIIMLAIPFAFTGVILALLLTNTTLSIVAALGAIMLVGIVTKNGIVLIDFINLMRERGIRLYDAIAQACRSRLRPVLMTSLTTILGMVPMAISAGEGSETWRPMGIAVIGGMVFSTIITMIIVPAVYAAMDKSGSRDKKKALAKEFKFMKDFDPEKDLPKK